MCYGMNCPYEKQSGPNNGDCRKPPNLNCPMEEEDDDDGDD